MENKKRLIDANAFRDFWNKNYRHQYANDNFLFALANFPTADAVEVVHGRWVHNKPWLFGFECDQCGKWILPEGTNGDMNYCPNCGAKMDKEN